MAAGETKVTQEGELGKKETTITIENSKEVENSRTEKITKNPVKKIVKIGTLCKAPTPNPGDKDNPSKPGGSDNPSKPGGDKPNPNKPGIPEETPDEPSTPEETPEKPEKPGDEKPNEDKPSEPGTPGKPGETPAEPGKTPDKETPKTPEGPIENPSEDGKVREENKENVSDEMSKKTKEQAVLGNAKSANPKTGIGSVAPIFTSMGISIAGLLATKKKKKEDE